MGWTDVAGNALQTVPGGVLRTATLNVVNAVGGNDVDCMNYQSASIQIAGTFVGTIVFEVSNDATNWISKNLVSSTGINAASATTPSLWSGDIGSRYFRVRMSAFTSGSAVAVIIFGGASQSNPIGTQPVSGTVTANIGAAATTIGKAEDAVAAAGDVGVQILGVRRDAPTISASATGDYNEVSLTKHGAVQVQTIDASKRTYAAAAKLTPIVGQVFEIFGSATATIEINRITVTLYGTAAGKMDVQLNKRSAAATVGTATNPTKVPYESTDAAAQATVKVYSVSPTVGALVGPVRQAMLSIVASQASDRMRFESGGYAKSIVLIGVAQALTLDLAGTVPTGAEMSIDIEWTEF